MTILQCLPQLARRAVLLLAASLAACAGPPPVSHEVTGSAAAGTPVTSLQSQTLAPAQMPPATGLSPDSPYILGPDDIIAISV